MFVAAGDAIHGMNVHAAFVSERAGADECLSGTEIHVGQFVDVTRKLSQSLDLAWCQHIISQLQRQIRRDGNQIDRRKQSAAKAVETKQAKMAKFVDEFLPSIPDYGREELIVRANRNFYCLGMSVHVYLSDERKCVNYLRHCETDYEQKLSEISGNTGVHMAYLEIKEKILEAIALKYDWLAEECDLQLQRTQKKFLSTL